jgi:hypothetical protein
VAFRSSEDERDPDSFPVETLQPGFADMLSRGHPPSLPRALCLALRVGCALTATSMSLCLTKSGVPGQIEV